MNRFPIFRNGGIIWALPGIKVTAKELERLIFMNLKRSKLLEKLKELKEKSNTPIKDTRKFYETGLNKKNAEEIRKRRKELETGNLTYPVKSWEESIDWSMPSRRSNEYISGATRVPWLDFYDWDEVDAYWNQ